MRDGGRRAPGLNLLMLPAVVAACGLPAASQPAPECDPDDGGLTLPDGFCALVVAEDLGAARHLAVAPNGDIYVALRGGRDRQGGAVALRDTTSDGRADVRIRFSEEGGTGMAFHDGALWFAPDWGLLRYAWREDALEPVGPPDTVVAGLPGPGQGHSAKNALIGPDGTAYMNIGAPSNACQQEPRTEGSPGQDPCPQLEDTGGVWAFDAGRTGQDQADGTRFATGLRNTFALAIHPESGELWGVQHGRDQLDQLWPDRFTQEERAEKPSEEFVRIQEGDDFGWPYCYHDPELDRKVLAPEYGGDGEEVGRCAEVKGPEVAYPAHWAPNGLVFYDGEMFPERYRNGAFIAWHGSWNRAPLPQGGYNVTFQPFDGGEPAGDWEVFADGFAGERMDPREAAHRPSGVAVGPDGSLYVADDQAGTIWRILYRP